MSSSLYDKALVAKLKNWTEKTQINVYGPQDTRRLFEVIGDTTHDENIKLPIIALRREGYTITNINKRVATYDGMTLDADYNSSTQLNMVPIMLNYQLDVYTKFFEEADLIMRDLIFNFINNPTFRVVIPYNEVNYEHNFNVRISSDIVDNSDIPERLFPGQFTRLSIAINIDDAYLWDARIRGNVHILADNVGIDIVSSDDDIITEYVD